MGGKTEKEIGQKARTVSFSLTPEEAEEIDRCVAICKIKTASIAKSGLFMRARELAKEAEGVL